MSNAPGSPLIISGRPTNLRLPPEYGSAFIDSDMHDICARVKELSEHLSICMLDAQHFAVTETDRTGVESLVFRVGPGCEIDALDGRVLAKLRYIMSVPLKERLRRLEAEIDREKESKLESDRERMWQKMGEPLYANLARLGFIHEDRPESYRPLNATARRAGRRMA